MLGPGYYINMFEVNILRNEAEFMVCERGVYPSLKVLREEVEKEGKKVFLYAPVRSEKIFGCGENFKWLIFKGFRKEIIKLFEEPRLTGRLILEGIIEKSKENGFYPLPEMEKGRVILFNENNFIKTSDGNVHIYKCYDIRVIYLMDVSNNTLKFYAIIDLKFIFRDKEGKSLSPKEIVQLYGSYTLKEVRVIQKDLIKVNEEFRANTEVSRQRLLEDIIPFVGRIKEFVLPCDVRAKLNVSPCRITIVI